MATLYHSTSISLARPQRAPRLSRLTESMAHGLITVLVALVAVLFIAGETPAQAAENVGRINGPNRLETAQVLSERMYPEHTNTIVLLNQDATSDAVSVATFAELMDASILLTTPDGLSEETLAEIQRLAPRRIFIVGGEAAVGPSIEEYLVHQHYLVERIAGKDRFETSLALFKEVARRVKLRKIGVVADEHDGMGTAAYRAQDFPLVLIDPDKPPALLAEAKVPIVVFGPTEHISVEAARAMDAHERIVGDQPIDVAVEASSLTNVHKAVLVNAANAVEVVLAERYASSQGAGVIMTDGKALTPMANQYLQAFQISTVTAIGGERALPAPLLASVSPHVSDITNSQPMLALTFDDGPNPATTSRVVNALTEHHARGTFFVTGLNAKKHPDTIRLIHDHGFEIGNHSWNHPSLNKLPVPQILEQINSTDAAIREAIGIGTTLLRPPYGGTNAVVKATIDKPEIMWSIDTQDWKSRNTQKVIAQVMGKVRDGDIILFHDIYPTSAAAIEYLIPALQAQGFQLVTVTELYKAKGVPLPMHGVTHHARPHK